MRKLEEALRKSGIGEKYGWREGVENGTRVAWFLAASLTNGQQHIPVMGVFGAHDLRTTRTPQPLA